MAINKRKILESAQKNLQKGLVDKALEDYRALLRADPHDSNVLLKVGDLYLKQGKRDESINSYLRVAQQFSREGFDAKAVALYKQIARLDPKRHDVCVPLAELYARMGLIGDAIASLQTAADAAYRAGDKDGALELLRRMAALDPSNTASRLKVAELLVQEGRHDEALTEYEAVADELTRRGEEEERIRVVERILAIDPERAPALRDVARARLVMSQFGAAQKLAEQLIASHPDDVEGYEILGHALLGAGDEARAREVFRDLAERFRLRGDEDRARDLMQRFGGLEALAPEGVEAPLDGGPSVLELDHEIGGHDDFLLDEDPFAEPAVPPKTTRIGKIDPVPVLKRVKAPPAAEVRAATPPRAVEAPAVVQSPAAPRDPESGDPEQLLAEATVYLRYGKHERAVGALRAILACEPDHRVALEHLAEALAAMGESEHAAAAWQRAAEAATAAGDVPGFERLRGRLAEVDAGAAAALAGPSAVPSSSRDAPPGSEARAAASATQPVSNGDDEIEIDLGAGFDATAAPELPSSELSESGIEIGDLGEIEFSEELDELEEDFGAAGGPAAEATPAPDPAHGRSEEPRVAEGPTATTPAQLTEQLEEAEFYLEQGLVDEARALYERILASAPNHPQALLRLGEIAAKSGRPIPGPTGPVGLESKAPARGDASGQDATIDPGSEIEVSFDDDVTPVSLEPSPGASEEEPPGGPTGASLEPSGEEPAAWLAEEPSAAPVVDAGAPPVAAAVAPGGTPLELEASGEFDLAAELAFGMGGDEPALGTLAGTEEEGFEQVFNAFKSGVERELGEGDHEARYDLGIAYKEMGLLEDAIGEFRIAMQAEPRRLSCLHMMGLCALELGRSADAVAHLEQALSLPDLPDDQRVPLRYDLGRAYAARGDFPRARAAFEEVRSADPGFGEVESELAALTERAFQPPAEEDEDGEAYESFDELLAERPQEPAAPRYESFDDLFTESADDAAPGLGSGQEESVEAGSTAKTDPPTEAAPALAKESAPELALDTAEPAFDAASEPGLDTPEPALDTPEPALDTPEPALDAAPRAPDAGATVDPMPTAHEPSPEPESGVEERSPAEPTPDETPDPSPKRKRRKISFV